MTSGNGHGQNLKDSIQSMRLSVMIIVSTGFAIAGSVVREASYGGPRIAFRLT
jgi:hypothetical protein